MRLPVLAPGLHSLVVPEPACTRLEAALRRAHALATGGGPDREQWAMNALEHVWLECLPFTQRDPMDGRVVRAIGFIRGRLDQPLNLNALAEHCNLSVSRLTHLFTAQVGESPLAFLERERMQRAAQLLRLTSLTVTRIAQSLGYADALYFSKRFRVRHGVSPRHYRANA
jgi:AraC family transcriptional regulator of arabinose operon